ncbi:MAG: pimeloyl-ACP methyl ester carboxylesterase [Myxococcota bacterium]
MKHTLLALALLSVACSSDTSTPADPSDTAANVAETAQPDVAVGTDDTADMPEPDLGPPIETCDSSKTPIVMAHGLLAAGDTWAPHAMRFMSQGYCRSHLVAFDWNTLAQDGAEQQLDDTITAVLADTGAQSVVLLGHSAGGSLGYRYLAEPARATRVSRYVHVGSGLETTTPDGIETLNLWSAADLIIEVKGDIPGATNVMLDDEDHYSVATSPASFEAIYAFVEDGPAPSTEITVQDRPVLAGKALTFGENTPLDGGVVTIFAVEPSSGQRAGDSLATFTCDPDGSWGPFEAKPGQYYELLVQSADPVDRPIHYYFEPFTHSNHMVYLRTLPGPTTVAGALLAGIPWTDEGAIAVIFGSSQSFQHGRDSLTIQGTEMATETLAPPAKTLLALFVYDDGDQTTTDNPDPLFADFPFLSGVDRHLEPDATITVQFNGRTLNAAAWPAQTQGAVVIVLN